MLDYTACASLFGSVILLHSLQMSVNILSKPRPVANFVYHRPSLWNYAANKPQTCRYPDKNLNMQTAIHKPLLVPIALQSDTPFEDWFQTFS